MVHSIKLKLLEEPKDHWPTRFGDKYGWHEIARHEGAGVWVITTTAKKNIFLGRRKVTLTKPFRGRIMLNAPKWEAGTQGYHFEDKAYFQKKNKWYGFDYAWLKDCVDRIPAACLT